VIVALIVAAPVIVAALVSRNDAVAVVNAVNEHATCDGGNRRTASFTFTTDH
jgi:hypothetical protein